MRLASLEEVPYELLKTGAVRPKVSRKELLLGISALRHYDIVPRAGGAGFCTLCKRCANACPQSAVAVTLNGASVDKKRCVSCGLCVRACPLGFVLWAGRYFATLMSKHYLLAFRWVHGAFAIVSAMGVITHLFIVHLRPDKFPLNPSIFTGEVPLEEVQERPLWLEELGVKGERGSSA